MYKEKLQKKKKKDLYELLRKNVLITESKASSEKQLKLNVHNTKVYL